MSDLNLAWLHNGVGHGESALVVGRGDLISPRGISDQAFSVSTIDQVLLAHQAGAIGRLDRFEAYCGCGEYFRIRSIESAAASEDGRISIVALCREAHGDEPVELFWAPKTDEGYCHENGSGVRHRITSLCLIRGLPSVREVQMPDLPT